MPYIQEGLHGLVGFISRCRTLRTLLQQGSAAKTPASQTWVAASILLDQIARDMTDIREHVPIYGELGDTLKDVIDLADDMVQEIQILRGNIPNVPVPPTVLPPTPQAPTTTTGQGEGAPPVAQDTVAVVNPPSGMS